MPFAKNIMQGGLSGATADAINGQVANGVTATPAGTQATALLVSADIVYVNIASGSGAVRLYAGQNGDSCLIINGGPSNMYVWPPSGVAFLGTATNAAVTVSPSVACRYTCINSTTWVTELSAGGGTS
jgi:hypothetical protein